MDNSSASVLQPVPVPRPEEVLEQYYDRLQQWAAVLTRGDVSAARDIVHDLYLYVTLAKSDLSRVENLDNYLYTCLRHIHLSHLSSASRQALQQASLAELDFLQLALWVNPYNDPLEHQNDLRQICNYAVWRKAHAKSASIFILRFFHGYRFKEVADIAGVSLSAIRPQLSNARSEIQVYLDDPNGVQAPSDDRAVKLALQWTSVSSLELFRELRDAILKSRTDECLSEKELLAYYRSLTPKALSCSLLSHIVSCERCLSLSDRHFRRPTLKDREPLDGLANPSKGHPRKAGATMSSPGHHELLRTVLKHRDDLYDHRPNRLSIAVDGKIIACQHVLAQRSMQSARIDKPENAHCVEVFSELGLRLVFLLLSDLPPNGPFAQEQRVELSDDRWIRVSLTFDSLGMNGEVTYFDPAIPADIAANASEDDVDVLPIRVLPDPLLESVAKED
jgi:RNA polymerase sigma factor (sigma-70 family)